MAKLGISSELFTAIRAVLAVVVFVMISYVRARARAKELVQEAIPMVKPVANRVAKITVVEANQKAIPEVAISHEEATVSHLSNKKELIKEAIARANEQGLKINLKAISLETGAGYSTVKLYASDIKKELGIE
jgi:predicted urease superfamily metal-dependent hydrolase